MLPERGGDMHAGWVGELAMRAWWACWKVARLRHAGVVGWLGSLLARACKRAGAWGYSWSKGWEPWPLCVLAGLMACVGSDSSLNAWPCWPGWVQNLDLMQKGPDGLGPNKKNKNKKKMKIKVKIK